MIGRNAPATKNDLKSRILWKPYSKQWGSQYWALELQKYDSNCCVFRPAFGCCEHPKADRTTFFRCFQPFLLYILASIAGRNSVRTCKFPRASICKQNWTFISSAWGELKHFLSPLVTRLFFDWFHPKKLKINEKRTFNWSMLKLIEF